MASLGLGIEELNELIGVGVNPLHGIGKLGVLLVIVVVDTFIGVAIGEIGAKVVRVVRCEIHPAGNAPQDSRSYY